MLEATDMRHAHRQIIFYKMNVCTLCTFPKPVYKRRRATTNTKHFVLFSNLSRSNFELPSVSKDMCNDHKS